MPPSCHVWCWAVRLDVGQRVNSLFTRQDCERHTHTHTNAVNLVSGLVCSLTCRSRPRWPRLIYSLTNLLLLARRSQERTVVEEVLRLICKVKVAKRGRDKFRWWIWIRYIAFPRTGGLFDWQLCSHRFTGAAVPLQVFDELGPGGVSHCDQCRAAICQTATNRKWRRTLKVVTCLVVCSRSHNAGDLKQIVKSVYLVLGASPRGACGLRQGMDMMLMLRYRPWLVVQVSSGPRSRSWLSLRDTRWNFVFKND